MLAMFQVPNRFYRADGTTTDMLGQDWATAWGGATNAAGSTR